MIIIFFRFCFCYHKATKVGLHTGLLMDHVNHEIDLVNWYFGACPFKAYKLKDSNNEYAVSGIREDGLIFSFAGVRSLERSIFQETMDLRFEKGEADGSKWDFIF